MLGRSLHHLFKRILALVLIYAFLKSVTPPPFTIIIDIFFILAVLSIAKEVLSILSKRGIDIERVIGSYLGHQRDGRYVRVVEEQRVNTSVSSKAISQGSVRKLVEGRVLNLGVVPREPTALRYSLKIDEYVCKAIIGHGGFGTTLLCNDDMGNAYAIKVPRDIFESIVVGSTIDVGLHESLKERFAREAEIIKRLRHTHIVQLIDYGFKPFPYLVYEYLDGGSLRDVLKHRHRLDLETTIVALLQISYALDYAYSKGLEMHGDLKPENVLFTRQGLLKVCDFNISRLAESTSTTRVVFGTPGYAAPEQLIYGLGKPSRKSDVFSLGILMYEMCTGRNPLLGVPPSNYEDILRDLELRTGIKELDELFTKMVKIRQELRPDIDHVIEVLENVYLTYIIH